jgi:hypothetical protein
LKPVYVLVDLADALANEPRFWDCVDDVRAGADALAAAQPFGGGERNEVIAWLLRRAAREKGDRDREYKAMIRGAVPVESPEEAQESGTAGTYRYRREFRASMREGTILIARRGSGLCLLCGAARSATRQREWLGRRTAGAGIAAKYHCRDVRADYCRDHEGEAFEDAHESREEAMRNAFDAVREAQRAMGP